MNKYIEEAKEKFGVLLEEQLQRVDRMKAENDFIDYSKLDKIIIGVVGGDGIGPAITAQAQRILEFLGLARSARYRSASFGGDDQRFFRYTDFRYYFRYVRLRS